MPSWTNGVVPQRRKEWRKAGRWNPVTAGTHDGAPAPSGPAPVPASSWTAARPSGQRGGASIGQGRVPAQAPVQEDPHYNNDTDALPLQPPAPVDGADEDPHYNTDELPAVHQNAYSRLSDLPDEEHEEEEEEHYNNVGLDLQPQQAAQDQPAQQQAPGQRRAYDDPRAAAVEEPVPGASYYSEPELPPEPDRRAELEAQVTGENPLQSEDPDSWAPLKPQKAHHNRLLARLGSDYETEKGEQRAGLMKALRDGAAVVARRWGYLQTLKQMRPDDDAALQVFVDGLPALMKGIVENKPYQAVVAEITRLHAEKYVSLRRQGLPVSVDGTIDESDPAVKDRKVGYDEGEQEQAKTLVHVDTAGKLRRSTPGNPPVDTSRSVTHFSGAGAEIYVVGKDGDLHMNSQALGQYHHSSLLAGGDVAMAGEICVDKGTIKWLSDKSGHYVPSEEQLLQFLHTLEKDGVKLDFELRGWSVANRPGVTAEQLLHPDPDSDADAWSPAKTKLVMEGFTTQFGADAVRAALGSKGWQEGPPVTDAQGQPVPDRDLRRFLKAHFGAKSRAKVQRGDHSGNRADLGFVDPVRSAAELRNPPQAADEEHTYDVFDPLRGAVPDEAPAPAQQEQQAAPEAPARPGNYARFDSSRDAVVSIEEAKSETTYTEVTAAQIDDDSDWDDDDLDSDDESDEEHDEEQKQATDKESEREVPAARESQDDLYEKYEAPVTPHTQLLQAYIDQFGKAEVGSVLRREALYFDEHDGLVCDPFSRPISREDLAGVLSKHLGPLGGGQAHQGEQAPQTEAISAYSYTYGGSQ